PAVAGSGVTGSTGPYRLDISRTGAASGGLFSAVAASAAGRPASNAELFRMIGLLAGASPGPSEA
ncbi:MAG: hypothetical protein RLZZ440_2432, partial [Planctomycetota bacterium]